MVRLRVNGYEHVLDAPSETTLLDVIREDLGLTAAVQFAFVAASGSVALLADGLHNLGDVFTTVILWIAFLVGRRQPDRGHSFGFARAEDVAGVLVVLAIAASAVVAASESLAKLA